MKTTVIMSLRTMSPSEVIESIESIANVRVSSYKIVNSVGYFECETIDPSADYFTDGDDNPDDDTYEGYDDECVMCGRERMLNSEGYCSMCWTIWNS